MLLNALAHLFVVAHLTSLGEDYNCMYKICVIVTLVRLLHFCLVMQTP